MFINFFCPCFSSCSALEKIYIIAGVSIEDALIRYTQKVLSGTMGDEYAEQQGRISIIK